MNVFQDLRPKEYATMAESITSSLAFPEFTARDVMMERNDPAGHPAR